MGSSDHNNNSSVYWNETTGRLIIRRTFDLLELLIRSSPLYLAFVSGLALSFHLAGYRIDKGQIKNDGNSYYRQTLSYFDKKDEREALMRNEQDKYDAFIEAKKIEAKLRTQRYQYLISSSAASFYKDPSHADEQKQNSLINVHYHKCDDPKRRIYAQFDGCDYKGM